MADEWDIERLRRLIRTPDTELSGDDIKYVDLYMHSHTAEEVEEELA